MLHFKRSMLSLALASALQTVSAGAQAVTEAEAQQPTSAQAEDDKAKQDRPKSSAAEKAEAEEAEAIETMTVTGIRAGIERAIDTKRQSTAIVEAISAEDIGKLPDTSIAESIARLPGLTMQRVAGRASTVSIRGLADDFGTTLLNGREQVSVGNNRGVEFDQYPSELMSGVVVYKTPTANLVGQGLSGTVDLKTVRPLAYSERVTSINGRLEKNSNGELNPGYDDTGNRFSFSYIDQFLDNTLGLAVGYAHLDTPGQANRWEAWGYPQITVNGQNAYLLGGSKSQASSSDNVRDGLMAVLEYKPNENYSSIVDAYVSRFDQEETVRFVETGLGWSGASLSNAVVENGQVVSGTFTGVRPVLRNDLNTRDDEISAFGWKNEFRFGDNWTALADISHSEAERDEMLLETYSGLGHHSDPNATAVVQFTQGGGRPQFSYNRGFTDANQIVLTDPAGWGQAGFVKYPHVEDELTSLRASAERMFDEGMFKSVEFGLNHADREKSRASGFEGFLRIKGANTAVIPSDALEGPADLGYTGIAGTIAYDVRDVLGMYNFDELVHADVRNKNWTVNEKVTTLYSQLNIDTDLGSMPLKGAFGVQAVRTDQSSDGMIVPFGTASAPVAISGGDTYTDILPTLNLSLGLTDEQIIRLGLGKQLARARMDDMRANQNVDIPSTGQNAFRWVADGGNPELKPWEAYAADLSYEWYFGEGGYLSVAGFYKDLRTYIYSQTLAYDFTGYDPRDKTPVSNIGIFTSPTNGEGGKLHGYEVAASLPLSLVSQALDGFGLVASYSNTKSSIEPLGPDHPDEPIPGLSEVVSNITAYYEKNGFSARISQRHRDDFLGEVQGFGGDRSKRYIQAEDIVDAQIGYSFGEGSAVEGLSLLVQANNLTNEKYREYFQESGLPRIENEFGRVILAGATYKF
ncbi:MAG: TonB-dependent receptor [Gammaproteobacteria bacterium]|nr:TonB-dependent receptor [Gammaproteobacteria bacterium]